MKKTQVALAALALVASTAVLADGVTVYGAFDASIGHANNGKGTYFDGTGSWNPGNNLGFKGTEDLGGGMKIGFQLEAGVGLNNGSVVSGGNGSRTGSLFSRIATVGLSGDFGSLNVGQQLSPFIAANAAGTAGNASFFVNRMLMVGFGGASVDASATTSSFPFDGFFIPNSFLYTSPSIGGWTVNAMTTAKAASKDGAIQGPVASDQYSTVSLGGAIGPINVIGAYQQRKNVNSGYTLSASMPLTSELSLAANYLNNDETASSGSGISTGKKIGSTSISTAYKLSDALTANLQYARNDDTGTAQQTLTSVGVSYALSKRTMTYASYGSGKGGVNAAFADRGNNNYAGGAIGTNSSTNFSVGVATSF